MMKPALTLALAGILALTAAAGAQTAQPPASPPAPAAGTPGTANLTPAQQANRDRIKNERQTCRAQAQGQGLKGPAVQSAVMDCMSKVDPKAAKRMGCFQAAKAKSLAGDDMKKSVKECMQAA